MSEVEFKESDGWVPVETTVGNLWCPDKPGDHIQGIYLSKRENVGINHSTVYNIKNEKGEFLVFGTKALLNAFKQIKVGNEVGIVYKGDKPSQPPKKPYKLFNVFQRPVKKSEAKKEQRQPPTKQETKPEKEENKAKEMNLSDDSETWGLIEMISTDLAAEHKHVNDKEILKRAIQMSKDSAQDFTEKELKDVERVLNQGLLK